MFITNTLQLIIKYYVDLNNRMKKQGTIILYLSYAVLALLFCASSYADIIDHKRYTSDTETGLDWLDVTASINMSYNEVEKQLEPGGKFQGYRYATAEEFNTFVGNYTGSKITQTQIRQVLPKSANIEFFMKIIGSTQRVAKRVRADGSKSDFSDKHWARMLDSVTGITVTGQGRDGYIHIGYSMIVKSQDFGTSVWHYSIANMNKYVNRDKRDPEAGSFLVKESKAKSRPTPAVEPEASSLQSLIDEELKKLDTP